MLEQLQLRKPKNVLQIWLIIAKEKKQRNNKNIKSLSY